MRVEVQVGAKFGFFDGKFTSTRRDKEIEC